MLEYEPHWKSLYRWGTGIPYTDDVNTQYTDEGYRKPAFHEQFTALIVFSDFLHHSHSFALLPHTSLSLSPYFPCLTLIITYPLTLFIIFLSLSHLRISESRFPFFVSPFAYQLKYFHNKLSGLLSRVLFTLPPSLLPISSFSHSFSLSRSLGSAHFHPWPLNFSCESSSLLFLFRVFNFFGQCRKTASRRQLR